MASATGEAATASPADDEMQVLDDGLVVAIGSGPSDPETKVAYLEEELQLHKEELQILESELQVHKEEMQLHKVNAEETLLAFLQFAEGVRVITRHIQEVPPPNNNNKADDEGDGIDKEESKEQEDVEEEKSAQDDDADDAEPENPNNSKCNSPLLEIESMVSNTCLQGTVFGTDLIRLWDAALHMRDFARLVSEESTMSVNDILQAQLAARKALLRAKRSEGVARDLHTKNKALKQQVRQLTSERRLLVQEVKSLRQQAAMARKVDMQRLLQQHVEGALLVHEEQLKATLVAQQQQQKQWRRRKHANAAAEEEKKEDPDDDSVEVVGLDECEEIGRKKKTTQQDDASTASASVKTPPPVDEDASSQQQGVGRDKVAIEEPTTASPTRPKIEPSSPKSQAELIAIAKARADAKEQQEGGAFGIFKRALGSASPRRSPANSPRQQLEAVSVAPVKPKEAEAIQLPSLVESESVSEASEKKDTSLEDEEEDSELVSSKSGESSDGSQGSDKENKPGPSPSDQHKEEIVASGAKQADAEGKDDVEEKPIPSKPEAQSQDEASSSYAPVKLFPSFGRISPPPPMPPPEDTREKPPSNRSVGSHDSWFDGPVEPKENVGSKVFNFLFYPEKIQQQRQQELQRQQQLRRQQQERQQQQHQQQQPKSEETTTKQSQNDIPQKNRAPTPVRASKNKGILDLHDPPDKDEASVDATVPTITATTPGSTCASGSRGRSMSGERRNPSSGKQSQQQQAQQKGQFPQQTFIPNCVSFSDDTLSVQSNLPSPKLQPSSKRSIAIGATNSDDDGDLSGDENAKGTSERQVELYQDLKVFRSLAIPTDDEIDDYQQYQKNETLLRVQQKSPPVIQ